MVTPEATPDFAIEPVQYSDLPAWSRFDPAPAVSAMLQSCQRFATLPAGAAISKRAAYDAGTFGDWADACAAVQRAEGSSSDVQREIFEAYFLPFKVSSNPDASKLTGYFEPSLRVNTYKAAGFDTPILTKPDDLITADLSAFHDSPGAGRIVGKVENGKFVPYDERADISVHESNAIAWAESADVFYLQIQGSGRLLFPDGRQLRAAFAAHNGQPFKSVARHLIEIGEIQPHQAGMADIKAWMKRVGPDAARKAMNVNPRFVWFAAETIANPELGPRGAQGVPLTPMGSMAVDPAFHPYGVPIYLDTKTPKRAGDWQGQPFRSLVVAQDTGGAIRGALRGDLFFGWKDDAGDRAAVTNHPLAMWVLLPRTVAERQGG